MSEPQVRRRAVRLTPEAHGMLKAALVQAWERDRRTTRFTREARAELMGLSLKTAERLWLGQPADRSTFVFAFKNLGLPWDDAHCEVMQRPLPIERADNNPGPVHRERNRQFGLVATAAGVLMGVVVIAYTAVVSHEQVPRRDLANEQQVWGTRFYSVLSDGTARYHRADYQGAERQLTIAVEMARARHSPGDLSAAVRMLGDLEAERGNFRAAEADYAQALSLRSAFKDDLCKPPIQEVMGDVQTRAGKFADARASLNAALQGFRSFHDRVGVALATRDLGSLSFREGHYARARDWFRLSLRAIEESSKPDIVADVRARMALADCAVGEVSMAREQLQRCLAYWTSKSHPRWIAVTELQLGTVEAIDGRLDTASTLLKECKRTFDSLGDRAGSQDVENCLKALSDKARLEQDKSRLIASLYRR